MVRRLRSQPFAAWHAALPVGIGLDHAGSTAKPSPPTSPLVMQSRTVVSNTSRSRSLSRKRPWRFFEKVEWSG
jgi:hypothetical protein